jgi:hypothetical protein
MNTIQVKVFGAIGAMLATVGLMAAMHGYAAGIQRNAPRDVIEMEPVIVIGTHLPRQAAAEASPHIGEI